MTLTSAVKRHRVVLLLCVIAQAALGVLATRSWLARSNTLQANDRWVSTKTIMERGLNGAFPYITERNALAGGELNLDAWYGHAELVLARPLEVVRTIEFEVGLAEDGWLVAGFNRTDRQYDAVRLSTMSAKPSAFLKVTAEGEFLDKQPFDEEVLEPGRYRARLELDGEAVSVYLNDAEVGAFAAPSIEGQKISFHGNLKPVVVDDIVVTLRDGGTMTEDFDSPPASRWFLVLVIAATLLLNAAIFIGLCRWLGADDRFLGFKMLMISVTLLGVAAVANVYVVREARWYPKLDSVLQAAEEYYQKGERENVLAEIDRLHERGAHSSFRVLVLGASQTWGAGALRDEDVWVRRLEESLNATPSASGRRVEVINGGISSSRAWHFMPLMKKGLLEFEPDVVVINLSSNDRGDSFLDGIRGLASLSHEAGARVVLVKEANSPLAALSGLRARHREMDTVADEMDLEVIDMQVFLEGENDTGLLWWDKVHLTSFGQELMAGEMERRLRPVIQEVAEVIERDGESPSSRLNAWNFERRLEGFFRSETPGRRQQLAEYIATEDVRGRQRLPGNAQALAVGLHSGRWTRGVRPAAVVVENTDRAHRVAQFEITSLAPAENYPIEVSFDDGLETVRYTLASRGKIRVPGVVLEPGEKRLLVVQSDKFWVAETSDRQLGVNLTSVALIPTE